MLIFSRYNVYHIHCMYCKYTVKFWPDDGVIIQLRLQCILRTWMFVLNLSACRCGDISLEKIKPLSCWWCQSKSQGIAKASGLCPQGTMNVCTKFHGNPKLLLRCLEQWYELPANCQTRSQKCKEEIIVDKKKARIIKIHKINNVIQSLNK